MEIKLQDRQTGKTFDIAQELKRDINTAVVLANLTMKKHFIKLYDFDDKRVFTINEVINGRMRGFRFNKIFIDEVGMCLRQIIPNLKYGTHTNE